MAIIAGQTDSSAQFPLQNSSFISLANSCSKNGTFILMNSHRPHCTMMCTYRVDNRCSDLPWKVIFLNPHTPKKFRSVPDGGWTREPKPWFTVHLVWHAFLHYNWALMNFNCSSLRYQIFGTPTSLGLWNWPSNPIKQQLSWIVFRFESLGNCRSSGSDIFRAISWWFTCIFPLNHNGFRNEQKIKMCMKLCDKDYPIHKNTL